MPGDVYTKFVKRCFSVTHAQLEAFITDPEFKCWNIHGVRRFCVDVATMLQARLFFPTPLRASLMGVSTLEPVTAVSPLKLGWN